MGADAFGDNIGQTNISSGFGEDRFKIDGDFLGNGGIPIPQVPDNTPVKKANLGDSKDSFDDDDEEEHMKITIRPKLRPVSASAGAPCLAAPPKLIPPPKSPSRQAGYQVQPDRFNPFDKVRVLSRAAHALSSRCNNWNYRCSRVTGWNNERIFLVGCVENGNNRRRGNFQRL